MEATQLPQSQQEILVAHILGEIHSERRWAESFARSEEILAHLADEALADYGAGKAEELDPEKL